MELDTYLQSIRTILKANKFKTKKGLEIDEGLSVDIFASYRTYETIFMGYETRHIYIQHVEEATVEAMKDLEKAAKAYTMVNKGMGVIWGLLSSFQVYPVLFTDEEKTDADLLEYVRAAPTRFGRIWKFPIVVNLKRERVQAFRGDYPFRWKMFQNAAKSLVSNVFEFAMKQKVV